MRELLSGLKSEQGNDGSYDASSPYRQNKRHMIFGTYRQNLLWMNPPALEKMDDAKPVILVSKSSRIVSGDVDPFEARFVDFCKNGLALDASSYTEAIKSFKETKDVLSTNVCAIGSGTHEAERFWFSLVLYTIKKLCHKDIDNMQQAYHDNGITLCQIFKAAKLNIADFFKELPQFVVKAGSILSKLYGTEWENRPEKHETSLGQNGDMRSPKRECTDYHSVLVEWNSFTSPVKDRFLAHNNLEPKLPPLQSGFASPTRPNPRGGGETCAETGINVFFGKISQLSLTFREIINNYRKQPHCKPQVFQSVFIHWSSAHQNGVGFLIPNPL